MVLKYYFWIYKYLSEVHKYLVNVGYLSIKSRFWQYMYLNIRSTNKNKSHISYI